MITGSTQGIGLGLAKEFSARGHQVLVCGRDSQRVSSAVATMQAETGTVLGQVCDVADKSAVQSLWDCAKSEFGSVDIWINNAGLARTVWPILDVTQTDLESMISTNVLGTMNGCRVAARGMQEQGRGKLFNMLGGGSNGEYFRGLGIYGSTKRGLDYFTDALQKELKDSGVIIGKIRPGMIITEAVVREARDNPEYFEQSRKAMNTLVDTVELSLIHI